MTLHTQKYNTQTMVVPDSDAMAQTTARLLVKAFTKILAKKNEILFIPSSGRTPIKTYHILATHYRTAIDWSQITVIQMDEYSHMDGQGQANMSSTKSINKEVYFNTFLQKHLVVPLAIGTFISMHKPNMTDGSQLYTPAEYAQKISALGPIDFALHGIGSNGHIGFNEPGACANSGTRIVKLAAETQDDNFTSLVDGDKPTHAMTLGLKQLRNVKHTLLIATGAQKADAIHKLLSQNDVSETPASILWSSPDFGIIIDRDAASLTI